MSSSGVVSKKLKFKGDKTKKKRKHHHDADAGGTDELEALAAADPSGPSPPCPPHKLPTDDGPGWMFPTEAMHVNGPAFIILPSDPPSCLAVSFLPPPPRSTL